MMTQPNRTSTLRPEQLVLGVARRYQLLEAKQAELLADRRFDRVVSACQELLEEGYLTTTEFQFLLARAEEVDEEGGRGVTGTIKVTKLFDLAIKLSYLSADGLKAFIEEKSVELQLSGGDGGDNAGHLKLLFNLGYLRLYQVIDLMEKLQVLLDHCDGCRTQTLAEGTLAGLCGSCGVRMQRITGWETEQEMLRPVPPLRMLLIRRREVGAQVEPPAAEAEPIAPPEPVASEAAPKSGRLSDEQLVTLIKRYRILDDGQFQKLARAYGGADKSLFEVLGRSGLVPSYAIAFLERRGPQPCTTRSLLTLAIERRYLSPGVMPHGKQALGSQAELVLLARTYNNRVLQFYQLVDLLASAGVSLEHCETCKIQIHVPADFKLEACPCCSGELQPLYRPGASPAELDRLPAIPQLVIQTLESAQSQSEPATEATPTRRERRRLAPLQPPPPPEALSPDELIEKLVLRYGLITPGQLNKATRFLDRGDTPLELALFQEGHLTSIELSFIKQKRAQASGIVGQLYDKSLTDIAISKGYLNHRRLLKISRMPGAPDFNNADDLAIATFLFRKGGLTSYQMIDLCEEIGIYLLSCGQCEVQYQLVGEVDPTQYQVCPECDSVLITLTTPPGWPLRLYRLPDISEFDIRLLEAGELTALNASSMGVRVLDTVDHSSSVLAKAGTLEERHMQSSIDAVPVAMADSGLMEPLEGRRQARRAEVRKAREAIQDFYQEKFPDRDLKAQPIRETRRMPKPDVDS